MARLLSKVVVARGRESKGRSTVGFLGLRSIVCMSARLRSSRSLRNRSRCFKMKGAVRAVLLGETFTALVLLLVCGLSDFLLRLMPHKGVGGVSRQHVESIFFKSASKNAVSAHVHRARHALL